MKKIDELVKKVEVFERLAVYGDRSTFLKSLAQEFGPSLEGGFSAKPNEPNASVDPNAAAPSGTVNLPADHITGYRPVDKNVQSMLNDILVPSGDILPLTLDGRLGPNTKDALAKFKAKYNKPASVAAITEVHNQVKNPSTVATPGAPVQPMGKGLAGIGDTKSTSSGNAGTERPVPGPKA